MTSTPDHRPRTWTRRAALGLLATAAAGCTAGPRVLGGAEASSTATSTTTSTPPTTTPPPVPVVQVALLPAAGATGASVLTPATVTASRGTLTAVTLTNPTGKKVAGKLAADGASWSTSEVLGYGKTYTWSGTAVGTDGLSTPVSGAFTTVAPVATVGAVLNAAIADGATVGVAAPIIVQFYGEVVDRAAVEKALVVTTTPRTVGSWAWLPNSDGGSRAHWRSQEYFAPGTTVDVQGKLYGLDLGDGAYGESDVSSSFTIGRNQVVKADATSHQIVVQRDGATTATYPVSYGKADLERNITRSGTHIVMVKSETVLMSNAAAGYKDVEEHWAVRISNNGEFIHANPNTVGVQGSANVSNGCINMSTADAQAYFATAIYGDPVEVTGTSIQLSAADGDVYDWALDWKTWSSMSALA